MNVQDNEQRQGAPVTIAGTDARCETADVKRAKRAPNGSRGVETFAEGTTSLIEQDYKRAMQVAADVTCTTVNELQSACRRDAQVLGRMVVAVYMCRTRQYDIHDLAPLFCRDRTTIYHYLRKYDSLMSVRDKILIEIQDKFNNQLNN